MKNVMTPRGGGDFFDSHCTVIEQADEVYSADDKVKNGLSNRISMEKVLAETAQILQTYI